jgi:hypothetical protein
MAHLFKFTFCAARPSWNGLATLSVDYRSCRAFTGGPIMSMQEWIALAIAAGVLATLVGAFWLMSSSDDHKR